jgi:vancomycin permeability regulator SanA
LYQHEGITLSNCLVLLGKNWEDKVTPKLSIPSRITALAGAVKMLEDRFDYLIISGGFTIGHSKPSEAMAMKKYILQFFPELEHKIIMEEVSIDTPENMRELLDILTPRDKVSIITLSFHCKRSYNLAIAWGISLTRMIQSENIFIRGVDPDIDCQLDDYYNSAGYKFREPILEFAVRLFQKLFRDPKGLKQKAITKHLRR